MILAAVSLLQLAGVLVAVLSIGLMAVIALYRFY